MAKLRPGTPAADWRDVAACRAYPPALFFPVGTGPDAEVVTARAFLVCQACPARVACLDYALTTNQCGIWGGTTEDQRRSIRRARRRRRAAAGA